jgi:crotonobetainyl-CoA:carnitine CoA-transferase CaiB-like acyl-CoA transferase
VAIDLSNEDGRWALRALIGMADVVIESSRPRALRQLGIDAEAHVAGGPGRTWVSITGYGRAGEAGNWIAFGDDAAVAGGLVAWDGEEPVFCADAIADPLTGLVAAVGALASQSAGGGHLIDVAMSASAAFAMSGPRCPSEHSVRGNDDGWFVTHDSTAVSLADPRCPPASSPGPVLGADTARVFDGLGVGAPA